MQFRISLLACITYALALTAFIQPANAGSFDMASNTTYENRIELKRTANDDYSDKLISHESQSKNSLEAATATAMDKTYEQSYKDFSNAFRLKNHENEESASKPLTDTINQVSLAVNSAIETLMEFIEN